MSAEAAPAQMETRIFHVTRLPSNKVGTALAALRATCALPTAYAKRVKANGTGIGALGAPIQPFKTRPAQITVEASVSIAFHHCSWIVLPAKQLPRIR